MDVISAIALLVVVFLVVLVVVVAVELAKWPRKIAQKRGHPQVDAINMLSWLGLFLTAGTGWIVAMVWASMNPGPAREEV